MFPTMPVSDIENALSNSISLENAVDGLLGTENDVQNNDSIELDEATSGMLHVLYLLKNILIN